MASKARQPVTIPADLYNQLVSHLDPDDTSAPSRAQLLDSLRTALFYDSCMDDGEPEGYCSTHDDRIEYWVDNFGPDGKVIALGSYAPAVEDMATCFPVCPGAQDYRYDVTKVGVPAVIE